MIRHIIGQDTRIAYEWVDDAELPVTVTAAQFIVGDGTAIDWALAEGGLTARTAGGVDLHLDDALALAAGNHSYVLRASNGTDWLILSAGLLRVVSLVPEPEPGP